MVEGFSKLIFLIFGIHFMLGKLFNFNTTTAFFIQNFIWVDGISEVELLILGSAGAALFACHTQLPFSFSKIGAITNLFFFFLLDFMKLHV